MTSTPKLEPFRLEEYFAKHEFSARYLLSSSDAESMTMKKLLEMGSPEDLERWENQWLGYTETQGLPALREIIVEKIYPTLSVSNILCFAGAEEGIYCALSTLLTREDHCIVVTPCYQSLSAIPVTICQATCVDLQANWRIDLDAIEAACQSNTKVIVINFPHNPTGALITAEEQRRLVEIATARGIWIFSDEVYRGLEAEESLRLPPIASIYSKGLSLGVVSKSLGLAGLRIGWIACADPAGLQALASTKHYLSICNSAPSETLSIIALRNSDAILQRNRDLISGNLALIESFLAKYSTYFEWTRPVGGCCGFVRFKATSMTLNEFAERCVLQYGVLILPGDNFPTAGRPVHDHFRFGFGRANFPIALSQFEKAISELLSTV